MSGIRGIKTVSPSSFPVKIAASITLPSIFFTHSLVPLHSFRGSMLRLHLSSKNDPVSQPVQSEIVLGNEIVKIDYAGTYIQT
jgi:hypothetical protein